MADILTQPFAGAGLWRGDEIKDDPAWIRRLDGEEAAEIDAALLHARHSGVGLFDMAAEHFPLGALGERLASVRSELEGGTGLPAAPRRPGLALLARGVPAGGLGPGVARRQPGAAGP